MAEADLQWWDVYVQVPTALSEVVGDWLRTLGSSAIVMHDDGCIAPGQEMCIVPAVEQDVWTVVQGALAAEAALATQLQTLQQWLMTLESTNHAACKLYCRVLPTQDYTTRWQQFFQPFMVGERLLIRPSWDTTPVQTASLTLDPGMAFGTGTHPTTRLCLTLLAQYAPLYQGARFLDVGCGSGILSLAALRLGLQSALGLDIEEQAVTVARHNAQANALQERVQFEHGSLEKSVGQQFALIAANIYLGPLVEMIPPFLRRLEPAGTLLLSGVLLRQEAVLQTALRKAGMTMTRRLVEDEWLAVAAQRLATVAPPASPSRSRQD